MIGKPLAALEEMGSAGFARLASRDPSLVVETVSDSACLGRQNQLQSRGKKMRMVFLDL